MLNLAVTVVYYLSARLGLQFAFEQANTSPIWPPTGLNIAAVLFFGYRVAPAFFMGSLLLNYSTSETPLWVALSMATGNLLEAVIAAGLILHFIGRYPFTSIKSTLTFVPIVLLCPLISAFLGATSLYLAAIISSQDYIVIFSTWWLGNTAGALVFTPLILTFIIKPRVEFSLIRIGESAAILLCTFASAYLVFSQSADSYAISFVLIPTIVWAALRFYQHGATGIVLLYTAVAAYATVHGYGPFVADNVNQSLLILQGFMAVIVITALTLASGVDEVSAVQQQLSRLHKNLELQVKMSTGELHSVNRRLQAHHNSVQPGPDKDEIIPYLDVMTAELLELYQCHFALVGTFADTNKSQIETLSLMIDGKIQDNLVYDLKNTPCADVLSSKTELISQDVAKAYPKDEMLATMGIQAYFGAPIIASDDQIIGIIVVMDKKPMAITDWTHDVLSLMAKRVAYEIQHQESRHELQLAADVFKETAESILILDSAKCVLRVNPAFCRVTGYLPAEITSENVKRLASNKNSDEFYEKMWHTVSTSGSWEGQIWVSRKDSSPIPCWQTITAVKDSDNKPKHYIVTFGDISNKIEAEKAIYKLAHFDVLTGLPNRSLFLNELDSAMQQAKDNNSSVGLLFMDLDRFKLINDSSGHYTGDVLLVQVAKRLQQVVSDNVIVSRFGGDEFTVMVRNINEVQQVHNVAQLVVATLAPSFLLENTEVIVSASIGYCLYPEDADNVQDLLKNADIAMYKAKEHGVDSIMRFTKQMNLAAKQRVEIENALRIALRHQQFVLHFQPQLDHLNNRVSGCEALVRWKHPEQGMIPPDSFIPVAEESGLIVPLGDWILEQACKVFVQWQEKGLSIDTIAVNLSARQFAEPDFCEKLQSILTRTGMEAKHLELELTESMLMEDIETAVATMHQLKSMGFQLSIDDFGTGYSSMAYIKHFPIDKLKIDKSFIAGLPDSKADAAIANTIINLARGLSLTVIAEGVETQQQADYLNEHHCHHIQGYWFCRPMAHDSHELYSVLGDKLTVT